MAAPNPKNMGLSQAVTDLGLGDALKTQLDDQEEERKKKLIQDSQKQGLSPASMSLGLTG